MAEIIEMFDGEKKAYNDRLELVYWEKPSSVKDAAYLRELNEIEMLCSNDMWYVNVRPAGLILDMETIEKLNNQVRSPSQRRHTLEDMQLGIIKRQKMTEKNLYSLLEDSL